MQLPNLQQPIPLGAERSQQISEKLKDLPETLYYLWEEVYNEVNMRGRTSKEDFGK